MEILKQFISRKVFSTSGPREMTATENDLAVQSQAKRQTQNIDVIPLLLKIPASMLCTSCNVHTGYSAHIFLLPKARLSNKDSKGKQDILILTFVNSLNFHKSNQLLYNF